MIRFDQRFDRRRMFQYVNDEPSVMHCHHYATLFTSVAMEQEAFGGPRLLAESTEDAFFLVLKKYFIRERVKGADARARVAEEYCALVGLGKLTLSVQKNGGTAEMAHSHVDEGWLKKWSRNDKPVNHIGRGYIAAAFSAINDATVRMYEVEETASIVMGAPKSTFVVRQKAGGTP